MSEEQVREQIHRATTEIKLACTRLELVVDSFADFEYSKPFNVAQKELHGLALVLEYFVGEHTRDELESIPDFYFAPKFAYDDGVALHEHMKQLKEKVK